MSCNWPLVTLAEVTSRIGDGLHGTPKYDDNGEYYFINGNNLSNGRIVINEKTKRTDEEQYLKHRKDLSDRTLLVSINGTLGNIGTYQGEKVFLGKSACYLNLLPDVDKNYVMYVLTAKHFQDYIHNLATGSTIKNVGLKLIREYEFRLPELAIQNKVSGILGAIDAKVALNNEVNQNLEAIAQATFKSWFVDFDPVKAKMNGEKPEGINAATASLFPEKLVESELGLIPEGWEASKLEDLVDIASSKRVFAKEYLEEGVPFYRGKEITELSKGNSVTPEIYISEERYQELKDKAGAPKEGDILITSVGTIGNTYLVDTEDKFYFKDGNLTWVRDYKDEEIPYFLMEWFKSTVGKCAVENIKIGSTQQAITIKSLNGIKLVSPSNDIHKKFTQLVEPLYRKHRANIKQSKALANLRDTLLPKLLSGEIELETLGIL